ncbi:TM2 domain protein [Lentilactobacillus sunkii]|uniref:TM2 domain protein n=1 Tax=Lentilactobacillus sunkii TaxID=481719 RepID=A0A1E7XDD6_9LACO|nr:TM2 domain-containing protein [Lentilactobacillus sunkii]OFA11071.1 TM2 domain protein [Lentilactobacillus sunkii]
MNNDYFVSQLTTEEMMLVNSEVLKRSRSAAVAYLLAIFTGLVGGHRYYMGKTGSAIAMTLITLLTLGIGLLVTSIWTIVDLFLINNWLQEDQKRIENDAAQAILTRSPINQSASKEPASTADTNTEVTQENEQK